MATTTYSTSDLSSKERTVKPIGDRYLSFMSEDQLLEYWSAKTGKNATCKEEKSKAKKLDERAAGEIRRLCAEGKLLMREIGEMFGVSRATVSAIKNGRKWKNL